MVWNLLGLVGNQEINGGMGLKSFGVGIDRIEVLFGLVHYTFYIQ
jgi:hypothetical protein